MKRAAGSHIGTWQALGAALVLAYHFQMCWVTAQAITTLMVYLLLGWDIAVEVGIYNEVSSYSLAIEAHTPIASTTSSP